MPGHSRPFETASASRQRTWNSLSVTGRLLTEATESRAHKGSLAIDSAALIFLFGLGAVWLVLGLYYRWNSRFSARWGPSSRPDQVAHKMYTAESRILEPLLTFGGLGLIVIGVIYVIVHLVLHLVH